MKMQKKITKQLLQKLGGKYSAQLKINLSPKSENEIFKWFLASKLFGARISEKIAANTYYKFIERNVITPEAILKEGWGGLVEILDEGGYVRYDFSTATKLLEIMKDLKNKYQGSLIRLYKESKDEEEIEVRLKNLGKGIGDVTVNIFLRELRGTWKKARPKISRFVKIAAESFNIIDKKSEGDILEQLEHYWERNKIKGFDFSDFEAALLRLGKNYINKGKEINLEK